MSEEQPPYNGLFYCPIRRKLVRWSDLKSFLAGRGPERVYNKR